MKKKDVTEKIAMPVVDEEIPNAEVSVEKKFLSYDELYKIEMLLEREKNRVAHLERKDLEKKVEELSIELLKKQITEKEQLIANMEKEKNAVRQVYSQEKETYKSYIRELKEKYNLTTDSWGFNPESGEIVE